MAKSGLTHIDVGPELTRTEWESEETHALINGTSFPGSPVERQLFYRNDLHEWYIYDGSAWVSLQGAGGGLVVHDNTYHDPDFEEQGVAATQIETHRTAAEHTQDQPSNFLKLSDTPAAFTGQAGKYPKVNVGESALEFDTPGGAGDMLKSVYDTDDDGVVDDSEKLEGSTKSEVQTHSPQTHGNAAHSPTFEEQGVAATQIETHRTTAVHTADQPPDVHDNTKHSPDYASEAALTTHEAAATGIHGVGSNHIAQAPAASHLVRSFTKGWTSGKLLQGAGVDADPTEILGTKRFFPRVHSGGTQLEWARGYPFGVPGEFSVDFAHWTSTLTGSGSEADKGYGILDLRTGTTPNSTARSRGYTFGWLTWANLRLVWKVHLYGEATYLSANAQRWIKLDIDAHGDPTDESIGFRIDYDQIKGFTHDGTTLRVTSALATGSGGSFEIHYDGTTVYWYYNGVLVGSSTDVPSATRSANHYLIVDVTNGSDTTSNRIRPYNHFWVQEI